MELLLLDDQTCQNPMLSYYFVLDSSECIMMNKLTNLQKKILIRILLEDKYQIKAKSYIQKLILMNKFTSSHECHEEINTNNKKTLFLKTYLISFKQVLHQMRYPIVKP